MKIILFIVGTPIFFAFLSVIRILYGLVYSDDSVGTPDSVSNLTRRIVIYMMGFLPIALIVQILSYVLVHILPYMVYRLLFALAIIISIAMGFIKYGKNSRRFNSFSEKKKWILCCLAFGFLLGLLETQLATIDSPNSTVETIIGYASSIVWSFIISGGFRVIPDLLIDLFDKLFDKK